MLTKSGGAISNIANEFVVREDVYTCEPAYAQWHELGEQSQMRSEVWESMKAFNVEINKAFKK